MPAHLRAMTARSPLLDTLRRSLLGAWIACAYALAVLAGGLAQAATPVGPAELAQAQLCSGQALPGSHAPDEPDHCKGCLGKVPVALPPAAVLLAPERPPIARTQPVLLAQAPRCAEPFGLQPSRGPPRG